MKDNKDGFLSFVQMEAKKDNKVFMLDTGEGRDYEDPETGWYVEDLSGWLIYSEERERFLKDRENGLVYDTFGENYVLVVWYKGNDDQIGVQFNNFPSV